MEIMYGIMIILQNGKKVKREVAGVSYLKKIRVNIEGADTLLYVTDDKSRAEELKKNGEAVLIYFHAGNAGEDFSEFHFGVEAPEQIDAVYAERVYRRLKGMPWKILETKRCLIRETTEEDVEDFFRIYSDPAITRYLEDLYPDREREREYIREYIDKIYTFYEFGVWTVLEKESGAVIGRAGFSYRPGFDDPEIGFLIGADRQRKGYAEEVCRAILAYGREELGFTCVQAMVCTENEASLCLCDKLGFTAVEELIMEDKAYFRLLLAYET